jgi:GTP diphosphokinase / guanosine-3',5'-bis(diphosphate) 3'-diphosphatase
MIRQFELVERVKAYDPGADEDALNRAYVYSMKAHGTQKRASGDPYFSHPLEVAGILTEFKLDGASIITALLHDTIEDTLATAEDIKLHFGDEVAGLVDGVTKLTRIELQSEDSKQAENFRKFVLAMSEDIRVLLVKLADRLHNMRTLYHIKSAEKRRRIAVETMEIYAPLAERIGVQEMKSELEDLAFAEINAEARASIIARLVFLKEEGEDLVPGTISELTQTLRKSGIKAAITGREKTPYSIWRKMRHKDISFEQLSDIIAFRIILDFDEDCYRALGALHVAYSVVPGRFKDYISTPKPNGYRSLHTSVIGPNQHRIEVQIRTREMNEVAEFGVAAHWAYKQGTEKTDGRRYRWLRELLEILDTATGPDDFLEHTKLEMFQDQVFCFTPKGDIINMPMGATAVDFAYAVHSEIGDRCVGAKVNGRIVPLDAHLENGDQVDIITSNAQTPSPTWERFIVTGKARSRIRRFVHTQERDEYIKLGRAILERTFAGEEYEFADKTLDSVLTTFKAETPDDIFQLVGAGTLTGREILEAVFPGLKPEAKSEQNIVDISAARAKRGSESAIPIKGLTPGMAVHFADCCHPLPGDRIVGISAPGKGLDIHTIDCESLEQAEIEQDLWVDVAWDPENIIPIEAVGRVNVTVLHEPGSLGRLSTVIATNGGNISNLKTVARSPQFFELVVDIEVRDVKHLTNIIAALRGIPSVNSVERARD